MKKKPISWKRKSYKLEMRAEKLEKLEFDGERLNKLEIGRDGSEKAGYRASTQHRTLHAAHVSDLRPTTYEPQAGITMSFQATKFYPTS